MAASNSFPFFSKFPNRWGRFLLLLLSLISPSLWAQNSTKPVYCVTACPAQEVEHEMNISWAADSALTETYVLVTEASDKRWRKARIFQPEQHEFCTVFDGKSSKAANRDNFLEKARFWKNGAHLTGLKADTEYKYLIRTGKKGRRGQDLSSEHRFKTGGAEEWSCCIISDYHSYPPLGGRLQAAMQMVDTVRHYDPEMDWILHVGDITAWGASYSFWQIMYEEQPFADFFWAGVNGNHDNMSRNYENSNQYFRQTAYYPLNGYEPEMGVCYHFRYGDVLFVMLNNEAMRQDEGLFAAQRWVKRVVNEARSSERPPRFVVVVEHYQWFFGQSGSTSQYGRWNALFDELGVDLAIGANNHIYARTGAIFDDKKTDGTFGTVYLQTSSSDNERGQEMQELRYNADKIESRFTEGGRTVGALSMQVSPTQIQLTLLDRKGYQVDRCIIPAKEKLVTKPDLLGNYLRDSLDVFTSRCEKVLNAAYMAQKQLGTNDSLPGWEGFPVGLYEYYTGKDSEAGCRKKGLVYMLNPDARKLAKWIIHAVYDATGKVRYEDLEKTRLRIMYQSGAQFPVSGVVYEDMEGDGTYYPYLFKDGLTVYLADEEQWKSPQNHPSEEQLQFYLRMTYDDLKPYTGTYARICSTTRTMYYQAGGQEDVGHDETREQRSKAYLATVAKLYQQAWKSDRNFLIYAWCLSALK